MPEPRMVDCAYVEERVQQFLDGELSETEADQLRFHLDACAHCIDGADLIEAYRRLVRRSCASPLAQPNRMATPIHNAAASGRAGIRPAIHSTMVASSNAGWRQRAGVPPVPVARPGAH